MADFDPDAWLKQNTPQAPSAPPPPPQTSAPAAAPASTPWYTSAINAGRTVWPYARTFADQAARGFVGTMAEYGKDVGANLPPGLTSSAEAMYGDPELARTRQEALGTLTREYTGKTDPDYPITGQIGRFAGETMVPSAIAGAIPVTPLAKVAEKGLVKGGKWLLKDATKGVAPTVRGAGGRMTANPAWSQAKIANRAAQEKLEERAANWSQPIANVERGTLAGAAQPTEDRGEAAMIGGGVAGTLEIAKRALPGKAGKLINIAAATAASTAVAKILPGGLEHIGAWGPAEFGVWRAVYELNVARLPGAAGKAASSQVGSAVTAGTVARGVEAERDKDRPTVTVPRRAQ